VAGLFSAGRRVHRTRYRPDAWRLPESAVAASGLAVALMGWWVSGHQILIAYPSTSVAPEISLVALAGALVGIAAAVFAPPPRLVAT
jgi:energy-coupling factor transport system permease protein